MLRLRSPTLTALLILVGALPLAAQGVDLSAYALSVGLHSGSSPVGAGGTTLLGRTRLMALTRWQAVEVDIAYEHVLLRTPPSGAPGVVPGGTAQRGGDWLGADWDLRTTSRSSWRHRFDRLSVGWSKGDVDLTVGRQVISWATTLFLTPADPFVPFDPSDPFREYRAGVDALRLRVFPGPFSEVEAVVRAAEAPDGNTVTALVRGQTAVADWSVGGWGGAVHGEAAGAVFATGAVGATAVRGELSLRRDSDQGTALRGAVGMDRRLTVAGRDSYLVAEVQYDGLGATGSDNLLEIIVSKAFLRGDLQVLSRWSGALQASLQLHPLVSLDAVALTSLTDGSALVAPGISWSATSAASLRVGAYFGTGDGSADPLLGLGSEYGAVPALTYAALSWFF